MNLIIIDGLAFALPLFVMAIGGIYCEKSGVTNLALEGFQGFGAFIGALAVVLLSNGNSQMSFYIAMIFAILGGILYSLLYALICIKYKANQVISGVVMNILGIALTTFLTKRINSGIFGTPSDKFVLEVCKRYSIPVLSDIPILGAIFKNFYPFEIIILVIAVFAWYILYKTRFGLRLRACGDNPHAVDAAGAEVSKIRLIGIMISGGLSGIAGISFAYSISANFSSSIYAGYGYLAMAAIIFGSWNILPTLFACLIFGLARSAGYQIIQMLGMPSNYSDLVMTLPYILTLLLLVFFSKYSVPPRALGEIYDKGKR